MKQYFLILVACLAISNIFSMHEQKGYELYRNHHYPQSKNQLALVSQDDGLERLAMLGNPLASYELGVKALESGHDEKAVHHFENSTARLFSPGQ